MVLPGETIVMAPTPDPTLTVITCAGDQNLVTRQHSHRLAIIATLAGSTSFDG